MESARNKKQQRGDTNALQPFDGSDNQPHENTNINHCAEQDLPPLVLLLPFHRLPPCKLHQLCSTSHVIKFVDLHHIELSFHWCVDNANRANHQHTEIVHDTSKPPPVHHHLCLHCTGMTASKQVRRDCTMLLRVRPGIVHLSKHKRALELSWVLLA